MVGSSHGFSARGCCLHSCAWPSSPTHSPLPPPPPRMAIKPHASPLPPPPPPAPPLACSGLCFDAHRLVTGHRSGTCCHRLFHAVGCVGTESRCAVARSHAARAKRRVRSTASCCPRCRPCPGPCPLILRLKASRPPSPPPTVATTPVGSTFTVTMVAAAADSCTRRRSMLGVAQPSVNSLTLSTTLPAGLEQVGAPLLCARRMRGPPDAAGWVQRRACCAAAPGVATGQCPLHRSSCRWRECMLHAACCATATLCAITHAALNLCAALPGRRWRPKSWGPMSHPAAACPPPAPAPSQPMPSPARCLRCLLAAPPP